MSNADKQKYIKDTRIPCKYGAKCYQKNSLHNEKYKHPPKPKAPTEVLITQPKKKIKLDTPRVEKVDENIINENKTENKEIGSLKRNSNDEESFNRTPKNFNVRDFIRQKFLVDMPADFYQFWEFCKEINPKCPTEALSSISLILVGPFEVLAGKFFDVPEKSEDQYLTHWRYYFDPPEFQTVLKGDDKTGYHIGYFRDSPDEPPVFLASNCTNQDGIFTVMGDNIFSAVSIYVENLKKTCDPFKKLNLVKFQSKLKKEAERLQLPLSQKTEKMKNRDKKIVTRAFSKMGIVVPYNRKTQVGYRDLSLSNKELQKLLTNIQDAPLDQRQKYLSELQDVITNVNIATDECDFGTGIELGLNILAHGVDSLDRTAMTLLSTNYKLINREAFAKIAEAHLANRKKGTHLSIL